MDQGCDTEFESMWLAEEIKTAGEDIKQEINTIDPDMVGASILMKISERGSGQWIDISTSKTQDVTAVHLVPREIRTRRPPKRSIKTVNFDELDMGNKKSKRDVTTDMVAETSHNI